MPIHSIPGRRWTQESIMAAIRAEARAGHDLSYSQTDKRVPSLLRAAERSFGSWANAVNAAGLNYDENRRYRVWTRQRVIQRIQELHGQGADLSWRNVASKLDPPLAAAVTHANRFSSWAEALAAAGLDPAEISRYRRWTLPDLRQELVALAACGTPLSYDTMSEKAAAVLAAVYRLGNGLVRERTRIGRSTSEVRYHGAINTETIKDGSDGETMSIAEELQLFTR